jgi:L-ascorbate metabolism protein UlaG (beta-lactamase superfamily)
VIGVKFTYYGHACFSLKNDSATLLFDPFLSGNPKAAESWENIKCDYILVSHAHGDHMGDAIEIAKKNGATIISTAEIASLAEREGCKAHSMNLGGAFKMPFGTVRLTAALHSAGIAGGIACGFVVNFGGKNFYFAGDTALFGDMELIGKRDKIDYAILPIGDNFTMGPEDAAKAAELLQADHVIPVHYNTWPVIAQNPEKFKQLAEKTAQVHIVESGGVLEIK